VAAIRLHLVPPALLVGHWFPRFPKLRRVG
jgi:hypothetical protein